MNKGNWTVSVGNVSCYTSSNWRTSRFLLIFFWPVYFYCHSCVCTLCRFPRYAVEIRRCVSVSELADCTWYHTLSVLSQCLLSLNHPFHSVMQKKISICINLSAFFGISRTERVFHIFLTISMADRREEIVNKVL